VEETRTQLLDYPITQLSNSTSVIVPSFNEAASIGPLVSGLRAAGDWAEILVVDDGSQDETGERARAAGARVIRHPYNKGNGAAVKTGIRNATGLFVLIIDADGPSVRRARLVLEADGWHVLTTSDIAAARTLLAHMHPDLILAALQSDDLARGALDVDVPVIAVTERGLEDSVRRAGYAGHVAKPIDVAGFSSRLRSFLKQRR